MTVTGRNSSATSADNAGEKTPKRLPIAPASGIKKSTERPPRGRSVNDQILQCLRDSFEVQKNLVSEVQELKEDIRAEGQQRRNEISELKSEFVMRADAHFRENERQVDKEGAQEERIVKRHEEILTVLEKIQSSKACAPSNELSLREEDIQKVLVFCKSTHIHHLFETMVNLLFDLPSF